MLRHIVFKFLAITDKEDFLLVAREKWHITSQGAEL